MSLTVRRILLLGLVFAFLFTLRFVHLGADPPVDLSISMGYFGDPGGYVANARNKIVFDSWVLDTWNSMFISPLPHYLSYAVFRLFGVGIAQMNAVPVLFSCGLLLLFFLLLTRVMPFFPALAGLLLLGMNYPFTMFSRIGVRAVEMAFFCVLALWVLSNRPDPDKKNLALAGALAFIAFTVKGTFLLILPAIMLGVSFQVFFRSGKNIKKTLLDVLAFGIGMAAVATVYTIFFFLPNRELFLAFGSDNFAWLTPRRLSEMLLFFWQRPLFYFMNSPVTTTLAGLGFLAVTFRWLSNPKKTNLIEGTAAVWFATNMLYFAVIYYRPARHFIPLIVAMALLAALLLRDIFLKDTLKKPAQVPLLFFFPLFGWFLFAASGLMILLNRPVSTADLEVRFLQAAAAAGIGTFLVILFLKKWPSNWQRPLNRTVRGMTVVLLVLAAAVTDGRSYLKWAASPRYDVRTISGDFGAAFDTMTLGGLLAPVISLENRHRAHAYYTNYINQGLDFLEKYGITHVFLTTYAVEKKYYETDFPEAMARARLLGRFPLWRTHVELFDLDPDPLPERPPGERLFEGEIFYGEKGLPRYDPDASGGWAFRLDDGKNGGLCQLPDISFEQGNHTATFFIKTEKPVDADVSLGRIDILDPRSRKAVASRELKAGDFVQQDADYQPFALRFRVRRPSNLIFRVVGSDRSAIRLDKVVVRSLD
ncbi:MAG: hypothetical protein SCM96_11710 [Acidobacteriota bacterium]|nr:hypothetical protein [Acidobacteriota bacterium]